MVQILNVAYDTFVSPNNSTFAQFFVRTSVSTQSSEVPIPGRCNRLARLLTFKLEFNELILAQMAAWRCVIRFARLLWEQLWVFGASHLSNRPQRYLWDCCFAAAADEANVYADYTLYDLNLSITGIINSLSVDLVYHLSMDWLRISAHHLKACCIILDDELLPLIVMLKWFH